MPLPTAQAGQIWEFMGPILILRLFLKHRRCHLRGYKNVMRSSGCLNFFFSCLSFCLSFLVFFSLPQVWPNCSHKGDNELWWLKYTILQGVKNWQVPSVYKDHSGYWLAKQLTSQTQERPCLCCPRHLASLMLSICWFYNSCNEPKKRASFGMPKRLQIGWTSAFFFFFLNSKLDFTQLSSSHCFVSPEAVHKSCKYLLCQKMLNLIYLLQSSPCWVNCWTPILLITTVMHQQLLPMIFWYFKWGGWKHSF